VINDSNPYRVDRSKPKLWKRDGLWGGELYDLYLNRYFRVEGMLTAFGAYSYLMNKKEPFHAWCIGAEFMSWK
jgi:hypothetical protein